MNVCLWAYISVHVCIDPGFPQNRNISSNTHLLLLNNPTDWIYRLIVIRNEIFKLTYEEFM